MKATYVVGASQSLNKEDAKQYFNLTITESFKVNEDIYGMIEGNRGDMAQYLSQQSQSVLVLPDPRWS